MTEPIAKLKGATPLMIAFGALGIVGVVCAVLQTMNGLQATNLANETTWGLYLAGYVLFTGVAAGCLFFASVPFVFRGLESWRPYARIASLAAVTCGVVCAGLLIMADVGQPLRAFSLFVTPNFASPLFWDMVVLIAYLALGLAFAFQSAKVSSGKKDAASIRPLAIVVFVAALLVTVTSLAFAAQTTHASWGNAGTAVSFFASAIAAGGALLIAIYSCLDRLGYFSLDDQVLRGMGITVAAALAVEFALVAFEAVIGLYAGTSEEAGLTAWTTAGAGAPLFYAEIVALVAAAALLLMKMRWAKTAGAVVAFVGILLMKYTMIEAPLHNPAIAFAGPAAAPCVPTGLYLPSLIECGIFVGAFGVGLLLFTIGISKLRFER